MTTSDRTVRSGRRLGDEVLAELITTPIEGEPMILVAVKRLS